VISKSALPVDSILPEMIDSLQHTPNLVIEAPPGAGKTTRVPPAILGLVSGDVIVLEPRRIASRMAARRVAEELGEAVGETIGYQVRFDERISPKTRLRFVTEGILTRRLLTDPTLKGVDAVVLDEFHERHLESDLALALLKRLQYSRPKLCIIVMSATLDAGPIAAYLGACPILRSEGRLFSLSTRHLPYSPDPMQVQVRKAVERLAVEQQSGNVLVFLPGIAEIRRTARECEAIADKMALLVLPLHGDLSPAEQDRVLLPTSERKLILATNVAESSVTVEGVTAVIDSGFARFASHSSWTGLSTLHIGRISKASAMQRAGRAGRTGPGQVLRLYPEEDFLLRPEHDAPEIERADLSQLLLSLRAMNIEHFGDVDWLTMPPEDAVAAADRLLDLLGATGDMARRLARFPLTPRLARIVVEGLDRSVGEAVCRVAAVLGIGDRTPKSDLLDVLDVPPDQKQRQHTDQLLKIARPLKRTGHERTAYDDQALLISLLAGFPDRVARRRTGNQVLLSSGLSAEVSGQRPAYEFMLAIDAEDRRENALPLVRLTSRIEPEWLLDLFPDRMQETSSVVFNRMTDRVENVSALLYDKLVIEESRGPASEVEAADLLARMALEAGVDKFVDKEALDNFLARLSFAGMEAPGISQAMRDVCRGCHSFSDLKTAAVNFIPMLENGVNTRLLNELAPVSIRLKGGRQAKVHYEQATPPWISSRLQDFFGMTETPTIGPGKTPLVIHLLAPNHRAVQTTTDLAGFWERLYPQVRRELQRRYPRHAWPEFPSTLV
jgi:ATP-dependent helicase HrpB